MEKENIVVAEDSSNAPPGPVPLKRVPPMMAEGEEGELHRIDELIRQLCSGSFCRGTSLSADAVAPPKNGNQLIMCALQRWITRTMTATDRRRPIAISA